MNENLEKIEKKIKLPKIDVKVVKREIEDFILDNILVAGKKGGVLGISGGIDSTTVAYLAKSAFDRYNNQKDNKLKLLGLIMPSQISNPKDSEDAISVAKKLGMDYKIISVQSIAECFIENMKGDIKNKYDKGNLFSEIRTIILSRQAANNNSLILGTGNRDEDYGLGYFTKRGDGQVDLSPIGELSKRHVREIAKYLGVSDKLIQRVPTAGLWQGQTDEQELGFSYLETEIVIAGKDQGYSREGIKKITNFGKIRKEVDNETDIVDKILDMHISNQFKMNMPPVAKITKHF